MARRFVQVSNMYLRIDLSLVIVLLLLFVSAVQAQPVHIDHGENVNSRLFVVRLRIDTTASAAPGECFALGPEDLTLEIRGFLVKDKEHRRAVEEGRIVLDRRPRRALHALVIDTSASMVASLASAQHAATEYVRQLSTEADRAMVITFDDSVTLRHGMSADRVSVIESIADLRLGGMTSLLDAIVFSARELEAYRERSAMVVLTDGSDTASVHDVEDVLKILRSSRDIVVFTIGVGLATVEGETTRTMLKRIASKNNGRFYDVKKSENLPQVFEEIRVLMGTEAILTVSDPRPREPRGTIEVRSFNPDCKVTVLEDGDDVVARASMRKPIAKPFPTIPHAYVSPLSVAHRQLFSVSAFRSVDAGCYAASDGAWLRETYDPESMWLFSVSPEQVTGCGPDIRMEKGPLYSPEQERLVHDNRTVHVRTRPFQIPMPAFESLVDRPEQGMDLLAALVQAAERERPESDPQGRHARSHHAIGSMLHGTTFLEARPRIARAMFLYDGYREWALQRLDEEASKELDGLASRYRRQFPGLTKETALAAARASVEGLEIMGRARQPSEIDLQPHLAAWLGDVSANELFVEWERSRMNRRLAGAGDEGFLGDWNALRSVFAVPSFARVLTPLVPMYSAECDCIGFWRVTLPRPSWLHPRTQESRAAAFTGEGLDLIADIPLGYWLLEQVTRRDPDLLAVLRDGGYRVESLGYELRGDPISHRPETAYDQALVDVTFLPTREVPEETVRHPLQMRAGVRLEKPATGGIRRPVLESLDVTAAKGSPLQGLVRNAGSTLIGPNVEAQESPGVVRGTGRSRER